jgi:hypothetical protein
MSHGHIMALIFFSTIAIALGFLGASGLRKRKTWWYGSPPTDRFRFDTSAGEIYLVSGNLAITLGIAYTIVALSASALGIWVIWPR